MMNYGIVTCPKCTCDVVDKGVMLRVECESCGYEWTPDVLPSKNFQVEEEPESDLKANQAAGYPFKEVFITLDETLKERGGKYGPFFGMALVTQDLKNMMRQSKGWHNLSADKKEVLDMIQLKISRILNGDPEYLDSWHDIIGYAQLIENDLRSKQK